MVNGSHRHTHGHRHRHTPEGAPASAAGGVDEEASTEQVPSAPPPVASPRNISDDNAGTQSIHN